MRRCADPSVAEPPTKYWDAAGVPNLDTDANADGAARLCLAAVAAAGVPAASPPATTPR